MSWIRKKEDTMENFRPATDSQFENRTFGALKDTVNTWASNQKSALDNVMQDVPTELTAHPPFVKAATWLSMGVQGTFTFFPGSALVASLESIAVPIAVVCLAVEIFKADYENHVKRLNAMMLGNHAALRDALKGKINNVAASFIGQDFGSHVLDTLRDVLKKRQQDLTENQVYSHTMAVLTEEEFGIIESNPATIQARTTKGYTALARKMNTLYEGTELAQGINQIKILDYSRTHHATADILTFKCPYDPKLDDLSCHDAPFSTTLSGGHVSRSPRFEQIVENLSRMEVKKGPWLAQLPIPGSDTVYVYESDKPDPRLADVVTGIIKKDKSKYPDIRRNIMAADEKLWARRRSM